MDVLNCSTAKKSREGVVMPLHVPGSNVVLTHQDKGDKKPREMFLKLLGPESENTRRVLASAQYRASNRKEGKDESNEQIEADKLSDCKLLAKLTVGGLVFWDGKWVDITTNNAADLYQQVEPFRGQAFKWILDPGNYIEG